MQGKKGLKMKSSRISALAAWALAFGCAIGWDAIVLPWTTFLPMAGPVGMTIGILIGAVAMGVIAWNYHYMINRNPGPGGAYTYAAKAFGSDHGFICAWFLCLVYTAIVWMDAVALVIVSQFAFGDLMRFGFHMTVAGHEVSLGHVVLSSAAIAVSAAACCRRSLSCRAQIAFVALLSVGIVACFWSTLAVHDGGIGSVLPAFAPDGGSPVWQVLRIVSVAPWLFVGFEAISQSSAEFGFPHRRSFLVMTSALAAATLGYILLTAVPVLAPASGGWVQTVREMGPNGELHAFAAAGGYLGKAGVAVVGLTLVGLIFTNLVGNMFAASRLLSAMADDGVLPAWFGGKGADGSPRNAVIAITCVSLGVVWLGKSVIGIVVDTSLVVAAVASAYTSAATYRTARAAGARASAAAGMCGLVVAVSFILLYILPNFLSDDPTMMSTESFLVLIAWCIAGLVSFLSLFHHDRLRRFGRSTVVWTSLLGVILLLSFLWMRQRTYETTELAFNDIVTTHSRSCRPIDDGHDGAHDWKTVLRGRLSDVNHSIMRNNLVQGALIVLALALMFCIYAILRRRERELEREKAQAKSYFFSTVSHDIRTPLNAIIGFSEMLKSGLRTEEEREQAIDSIMVSGRTLLGLINDVLDLSKLESGKMDISPEPTDVPRLMRVVMDAFRVSGDRPGLELRNRADDMPPLMLDPQRLRQIVFNLVGNAVKFTQHGYVELRASYTRRKGAQDGEFRLEVEDTGCGISDKDKLNIGSAYVQVGSRHSRNGGTGLGLAICSQLAAAMGGSLGVESELGKGSTFSVTIPGVKPAAAAPQDADASGTAPAEAATQAGPMHILLVDDSKMNVTVLKALLKHIGNFKTASASDGREALALLEASGADPFDMVLTDMWMPNLDGEGLVKAIRANPALASLRVVAVTADVEFQGKAADIGFDELLLKPVTIDKLRKTLSWKGQQ